VGGVEMKIGQGEKMTKIEHERKWPQKRNGKVCGVCGGLIEWSQFEIFGMVSKSNESCPKCGEKK